MSTQRFMTARTVCDALSHCKLPRGYALDTLISYTVDRSYISGHLSCAVRAELTNRPRLWEILRDRC